MNKLVKLLFFGLLIKPIVLIILGLNIKGRKNLPTSGPAIIVANHNSHLDTLVLMSLFPLLKLNGIRPVAAMDYFFSNPFLKWFALNCIGIIPIERNSRLKKEALFEKCHTSLNNGEILIIFPEGTRGNPEEISRIKKGVFHLVTNRSDTQITPIVMHGLGKSLPKGEALFVPFNCDVIIGETLPSIDTAGIFAKNLSNTFDDLMKQCLTRTI